MARVLILGGTRNLGHVTAVTLLEAGHSVTVLNRGVTADDLPPDIERLHAAREDHAAIRDLVKHRMWDCVVDTTSYTGSDATAICTLFRERCGRIVFISTGQVYLVRTDPRRPFHESDYKGPVINAPADTISDHDNWRYGMEKREAEAVFADTAARGLPAVTLRLPMVASERDHYARIQGYIARIQDGGPILIPDDEQLPIRHVYVEDVARVIAMLCLDSWNGYKALNISYGHSISLPQFFDMLGRELRAQVKLLRAARAELEGQALLPHCSPYSGKWMSELDNSLSIGTFSDRSFNYTGPEAYLRRIAEDYERRWRKLALPIPGYAHRQKELAFAKKHGKTESTFLD